MTTLLDDAPVPCLVSTLDLGVRACDSLGLPINTSPPSRTARQVGGRGKQRARRRACSGGVRGKEGERERERERERMKRLQQPVHHHGLHLPPASLLPLSSRLPRGSNR